MPAKRCDTVTKGARARFGRRAGAEEELDELTNTFNAAREYILRESFAYSFIMAMLRAILALNNVEGYVRGRHINYFGTFEGQDVLRFFCVLYTVTSARVIDVFRGGEMTREIRASKYRCQRRRRRNSGCRRRFGGRRYVSRSRFATEEKFTGPPKYSRKRGPISPRSDRDAAAWLRSRA